MIRLHFIVEGQTEKVFVDRVLAPHLAQLQIVSDARLVHTNWQLQKKGGMTSYVKAKRDVAQWISNDKDSSSYFTTMFDLYALPNDFPNYEASKAITNAYKQVESLETAFFDDLDSLRFIPYIQLHEFEALLFSDIKQLDWDFLEHSAAIQQLDKLVQKFGNPELINDHPQNAPSKRIIAHIPEYESAKSSVGPNVAEQIGLTTMRKQCAHFDQWITKLESLPEQTQFQSQSSENDN